MSRAVKGILLSGLVFPGAGQIALGRRGVGALLMIVTGLGVAGLIQAMLQRLPAITAEILAVLEKGALEPADIFEMSRRLSATGATWLETASTWLVLCCWLVAVLHAGWLGNKLDRQGPGSA